MVCHQRIAVVQALMTIFCFYVVIREGTCCRQGWLQYGERCFFIDSEPKTKFMARLRCMLDGGDLVSLPDSDTYDYIALHVATGAHGDSFWVGLHRYANGSLVWMRPNAGLVDESQHWVDVSQEPGKDQLVLPNDLFLFSCYAYNAAKVIQEHCVQRMGSICENDKKNKTSHVTCHWLSAPNDSFVGETTGRCLFRVLGQFTQDRVEQACVDLGGHFLDLDGVMKDSLTAFYEHKVLMNDGAKYWTGLTWNGTNVLWSTGKPLGEDYPIPIVNGSGTCIAVQFNFTDVLETHLFQTECDAKAGVICSRVTYDSRTTTPTPSDHDHDHQPNTASNNLECPLSVKSDYPTGTWKKFGDYCYWETSYETSHKTWEDAERFCRSYEGGHLASFHSLDEQKAGFSFQHQKFDHNYWIGLSLDVDNETYRWSDGTTPDYSNWAPGHPDHRDKRLRCVAINALKTQWSSSLCGIHSWFVCKVPKRAIWPAFHFPEPIPLPQCENSLTEHSSTDLYYFEDSCYFVVTETESWHRAKQHCENEGSSLVSLHSDKELEFLLKILHSATEDSVHENRVWIGLNSLETDGGPRWTDWSPVDYTYWNRQEPKTFLKQEKCCYMNIMDGLWNDENCNAVMNFICKRKNDTSSTTVDVFTPDPTVGNCKKGWVSHHDRCYYVGGVREKDRLNWTQALQICEEKGGYLTSIRDEKEQTFLSYLLQTLRVDAWIGLHDSIQSGRYYWVDNSEMRYSNWAPGEPSLFGVVEDCVKMVYSRLESGIWEDDSCNRNIGYICQARKDPALPEPSYDRGINCLSHEGWLKLDNTCYKMFGGNFLTWSEAETACSMQGSHLVSVFDKSVKAVASYLATEVNQTFWIGLRYKESSHKLSWLNGWPMGLSFWEKNEPGNVDDETCFASTLEGYWKKVPCEEVLNYVCQITTGKPPKQTLYNGKCLTSSKLWMPGSGSYCYIVDNATRVDFFQAMTSCYRYGSHLASIHSMEEIVSLKTMMKSGTKSMFIGLYKNSKGGFRWTDDSAVDFVNWDESEPDPTKLRDQCVEMMADTLKWRVTPCTAKKNYVCKDNKDTLYHQDTQSEKLVGGSSHELSASSVTVIVIFTIIGIAIIVAVALFYSKNVRNRPVNPFQQESTSFENALYNVNSASMEFHDEKS